MGCNNIQDFYLRIGQNDRISNSWVRVTVKSLWYLWNVSPYFVPLSHRKYGPDCGPCFLPGGLYSTATRPQPPKLQGLCPSCPKGLFIFILSLLSLLQYCLQFPSIVHFFNVHICLPYFQIPYLGFCACEEMGETGVWQLVDPPILPLTHGPNHSFNWREMLMHDWRMCRF